MYSALSGPTDWIGPTALNIYGKAFYLYCSVVIQMVFQATTLCKCRLRDRRQFQSAVSLL